MRNRYEPEKWERWRNGAVMWNWRLGSDRCEAQLGTEDEGII